MAAYVGASTNRRTHATPLGSRLMRASEQVIGIWVNVTNDVAGLQRLRSPRSAATTQELFACHTCPLIATNEDNLESCLSMLTLFIGSSKYSLYKLPCFSFSYKCWSSFETTPGTRIQMAHQTCEVERRSLAASRGGPNSVRKDSYKTHLWYTKHEGMMLCELMYSTSCL